MPERKHSFLQEVFPHQWLKEVQGNAEICKNRKYASATKNLELGEGGVEDEELLLVEGHPTAHLPNQM